MKGYDPEMLVPIQCTGFKAKSRLASQLRDSFMELYAGESVEIPLH